MVLIDLRSVPIKNLEWGTILPLGLVEPAVYARLPRGHLRQQSTETV